MSNLYKMSLSMNSLSHFYYRWITDYLKPNPNSTKPMRPFPLFSIYTYHLMPLYNLQLLTMLLNTDKKSLSHLKLFCEERKRQNAYLFIRSAALQVKSMANYENSSTIRSYSSLNPILHSILLDRDSAFFFLSPFSELYKKFNG